MSCIIFILLDSPSVVMAESDGNLNLNSSMINNQNANKSNVSDFKIRSQLFGNNLNQKVQENKNQEVNRRKLVQNIDFSKNSTNDLYSDNYLKMKEELFKNYAQLPIISNQKKETINNKSLFIIGTILMIPLVILSVIAARYWGKNRRTK